MSLGEPRDLRYNLARTGFRFFAASDQLVTKLRDPEGWQVEAADLVYYLAEYSTYCIARHKYCDYLPTGVTETNLEIADRTLHNIIKWAETADNFRYRKQVPVVIKLDMINNVYDTVMFLMAARVRELRITINNWRMEFGTSQTQSQSETGEKIADYDPWGLGGYAGTASSEPDFTVETNTNPYFLDLLDFFSQFARKADKISFDLQLELQAAESLEQFLRHGGKEA